MGGSASSLHGMWKARVFFFLVGLEEILCIVLISMNEIVNVLGNTLIGFFFPYIRGCSLIPCPSISIKYSDGDGKFSLA